MKGWHWGAIVVAGLIGLVFIGYGSSQAILERSAASRTSSSHQAAATGAAAAPAASSPVQPADSTTPIETGSSSTTGNGGAPAAETNPPVLQILSLKPGSTIQVPATVEYMISGVSQSSLEQLHLRLTIGTPAFYTLDFRLSSLQGTVVLPDDKRITGVRNLTFGLVTAQGTVVSESAETTISNVTVVGRR